MVRLTSFAVVKLCRVAQTGIVASVVRLVAIRVAGLTKLPNIRCVACRLKRVRR